MKVGVIGAGPAGLTCAYQLIKAGIETHVFEASDSVGGLAKTIKLWNQRVDLGPHRFFSKDPRVIKLWLEVVGSDYLMINRLSRIFYKNKLYRYPLKPLDVVSKLGLLESALCLSSYFRETLSQRFYKNNDETFEGWVISRFGRRLFEIFFKAYTEKLWGIPCDHLDVDFALQRIKKFSLYEALSNALLTGKNNNHKTLVERFAYPAEGTGMVYERMASYIFNNGGSICLNTPISRVVNVEREVTGLELANGKFQSCDHVVSSMPLTQLIFRLDGVPENIIAYARSLEFRNTILVYLNIENENLFPDNWIYIHSPNLKLGRVTNFRNWSPDLYGKERGSILALEYWCNEIDELWSLDDNKLIELGKKELRETGLAIEENILDGFVYRINKCYPIYSLGYKEKLKPIENHLKTIKGLTAIGRYGSFKYNNQDHSILMGILAAENFYNGEKHDLWDVNTDYEYQESAFITESGLKEV
ncbi:MAG: FAD-dependent oxidoreductase [Thermodesulfobacteriota bacterium]